MRPCTPYYGHTGLKTFECGVFLQGGVGPTLLGLILFVIDVTAFLDELEIQFKMLYCVLLNSTVHLNSEILALSDGNVAYLRNLRNLRRYQTFTFKEFYRIWVSNLQE